MSDAPIIEVRQSTLNDFELCAEMFRRKHIEKEPALPGTAALRGGAVHVGAQKNHEQKVGSGRDLPKKDIIDIAVAGFEEKKAREGFRLTPEEMGVGVKPTLARTIESVTTLTGLYADQVAPRMDPDLVEEHISFTLPSGIKFSGRLDLSTKDGRIKDVKTAGRSKSQKEVDESLQGTQYYALYRALKGKDPSGFDLEVLVDLKTPKVQTLASTRTRRDMEVLVNRANIMLRSVQAGLFAPAAVGSWNCCAKWCNFWSTCPFVNSERMAASAKLED
jgi:hypothetical protein